MKKILLISFDAVGSDELSYLETKKHFSAFQKNGTVFKNMQTIFISNTYPIHTAIATGKTPQYHGIISNTYIDPDKNEAWCYDFRKIKTKTLWQAAKEKGLKVATILWPVTGWSQYINWNLPEVAVQKNESQILQNLKAGSALWQISLFLKYRHLLHGIKQPNLDNFALHAALSLLKKKHVDLTALHLTCYDSLCHKYGRGSPEAQSALDSLDDFLGQIMATVDDNTQVIIFSDHAQLKIHQNIHPNTVLKNMNFLKLNKSYNELFKHDTDEIQNARCFFHYAGGSAFFFINQKFNKTPFSENEIETIKKEVLALTGVKRLLTTQELTTSGFAFPSPLYEYPALFGLAADEGYYFADTHYEKSTHGYPLDMSHYDTFCAINTQNITFSCKTVLDITQLVAQILQLNMN